MCISRLISGGRSRLLLSALLALISVHVARAVEPKSTPGNPDEKAIRATAVAFVEAFNRGSAKELAALWTATGSLADEQGELLKGRQAIEAKYAAFFKENPGAKIEITVKSVEFPTPLVAVEDGVAQVVSTHAGPPSASRYAAVHTLENGKWLMSSVRETNIELPSNFSRLQDLGWLIGKWRATKDNATFDADFRWIANKSFIQRDYTTRVDGVVASSGTQIIGWNPQFGRIRSWSFDSSGGHGVGDWFNTPDGWRIQSSGVQVDGTPTSSLDCIVRTAYEDSIMGWRSIDRRVGEVVFPNTPEVVFDRVRPAGAAVK